MARAPCLYDIIKGYIGSNPLLRTNCINHSPKEEVWDILILYYSISCEK